MKSSQHEIIQSELKTKYGVCMYVCMYVCEYVLMLMV